LFGVDRVKIMKKLFIIVEKILVSLAVIAFIYNIYNKIESGKAFERYRTYWLFEMDYFSAAFILIISPIIIVLVYLYFKYRDKQDLKDAKKSLEERREKEL